MFSVEYKDNNAYISGVKEFDLAQTLDCGQAFRWRETQGGRWCGVAFGRLLEIEKKDNLIILYNTTPEDFEGVWRGYFDLDRDYGKVISDISRNDILKSASQYGYGIQISYCYPTDPQQHYLLFHRTLYPVYLLLDMQAIWHHHIYSYLDCR